MTATARWRREAARWLALLAVFVVVLLPALLPPPASAHPAGVGSASTARHCHDLTPPAAPFDDGQDETGRAGSADHCLCCHAVAIPSAGVEPGRATPVATRAVRREQPRPADVDPGRLPEPPRPLA